MTRAPASDRAPRGRLSLRAALGGAVVVTLVRPATWVVALAGFLAGGGLALVAWPILVLPTPSGLQNLLGSPVSTLAFGAPSPGLVALIVGGVVSGLALLAAGLLAGAWAERRGIAMVVEAAAEEGFAAPGPDLAGAPGAGRVALVRLLSLLPPLIAAALAWQALYDVTYRELILPSDLAIPLPVRVVEQLPGQLAGLLVAWLVADAAASAGVRRLVLERRRVLVAWTLGWVDLARRPHRALATALAGLVVLVLAAGPALAAAALGWSRVREVLAVGRDPLVEVLAVMTWVAIWLGALVLGAVGAAFRAAAWTMEAARVPEASPAGDPGAAATPEAVAGA